MFSSFFTLFLAPTHPFMPLFSLSFCPGVAFLPPLPMEIFMLGGPDPMLFTWRPSPASQVWVNHESCYIPILPPSVVTLLFISLFPSLDCRLLEGQSHAIFILIESNLILSLEQLNLSTSLTKKPFTWGHGMSPIRW